MRLVSERCVRASMSEQYCTIRREQSMTPPLSPSRQAPTHPHTPPTHLYSGSSITPAARRISRAYPGTAAGSAIDPFALVRVQVAAPACPESG